MGDVTAELEPASILQMAGQLLDSADLLSAAEARLTGATRMLNALGALAASWDEQARAAEREAWHSSRDGHRAEMLTAHADELRQTIAAAAAGEVPDG